MASHSSSIYLRNLSPKLRPALDLLRSAIAALPNGTDKVETVLNLGCGDGNMTKYLCDAFPHAFIHGIDASSQKIHAAKQGLSSVPGLQPRSVTFEVDTIENYVGLSSSEKAQTPSSSSSSSISTETKYDVIFANSSLLWIPVHKRAEVVNNIVTKRLKCKGGVLAVQMPDTCRQPSHLLMEQAALRSGIIEQTFDIVNGHREQHDILWYHRLLTPICRDVDMWTTEYVHQLPHQGSAKQLFHPVLEYNQNKATGLLPYLTAIGGPKTDAGKQFIGEYNRLLNEAYPMTNVRNASYKTGKLLTLFPFKRFFLICQT